jgi:hypothetical protein
MRCGWLFSFAVSLLTLMGCATGADGPVLSRKAAETLLHDYTAALEHGDSARVYQLWSDRSRDRVGFWASMHFTIGGLTSFPTMGQYMKDLTFDIDDIDARNDYSVISLHWVAKDKPQSEAEPARMPLRLYVVHEDGRPVLIMPIDVLTGDWQTYEAKHVVYHYPPAVRIADHMVDVSRLDNDVEEICAALGVETGEKLHYYRTRSPAESGELMLQHPSNGYAATAYKLIVSHEFANTHEAVHMISHIGGIFSNDIALAEGLAVGFGGNTRVAPAYATLRSSRLLSRGDYIPLDRLFRMDNQSFLRSNYLTYFEAGAFIRFLHEEHGVEKLKTLLRDRQTQGGIKDALQDAYARSLSELEAEFRAYLRAHAAPIIPTAIPEQTEAVFSMADPAKDDVGDGDYRYPNERFKEGTFDLRAFEIRKDEEFAYFRISFRRLGKPVTYGTGGERFVAGALVAINRTQGQNTPPLRKRCHGVTFQNGEGYDPNDGEKHALEFALPTELIGTPDSTWKYFVGTCLMSDRTMDFLHAGPMPVQKEKGVFIGGGNYDIGNPAFMDILLSPKHDQTRILGNYNPESQRWAVVPMVGTGDQQD